VIALRVELPSSGILPPRRALVQMSSRLPRVRRCSAPCGAGASGAGAACWSLAL